MENRSFEGDPSSGSLPKDTEDNPPGPLKPRADTSDEIKDEAKEIIPPLARISADEDNSPNHPPLPVPDIGGQLASAPDPGQQLANAPDHVKQVANATTRSTTWRERCVSLYKWINSFSFQFPFHTLLLTWPLSTVVMGVLNESVCRMNNYLPYGMIAVGLLGFATVLLRLYVLLYEKRLASAGTWNLWIGVRASELIIWILFANNLYYFFEHSPSFTPGAKRYCKPKFYKINCGVMYLASATMIGWIIVNVRNFIYWFPRRNERSTVWFI